MIRFLMIRLIIPTTFLFYLLFPVIIIARFFIGIRQITRMCIPYPLEAQRYMEIYRIDYVK